MEELRRLGPRLRAARQDRGWTLEDLAGRAGMSVSTLSRLESGKRQATLELLLPSPSSSGSASTICSRPTIATPASSGRRSSARA